MSEYERKVICTKCEENFIINVMVYHIGVSAVCPYCKAYVLIEEDNLSEIEDEAS